VFVLELWTCATAGIASAAAAPASSSALAADCIRDVHLHWPRLDFTRPAGQEEQGSYRDNHDQDEEDYGSRHRAFPIGL
jgi:hypothetical protein